MGHDEREENLSVRMYARSDVCSLRDFSRALYPLAGRRRAPRRNFLLHNSPTALAAGRWPTNLNVAEIGLN